MISRELHYTLGQAACELLHEKPVFLKRLDRILGAE